MNQKVFVSLQHKGSAQPLGCKDAEEKKNNHHIAVCDSSKNIYMKQTEFEAKNVPMINGRLATLLYPSFYPWVVSQVIKVENQKAIELYRKIFAQKSLPMYFAKNGDKSFFVVQTRGCTPGKQLGIDQWNHSQVYGDIQSCLQAAADWWSEFKDSGCQIPLSL